MAFWESSQNFWWRSPRCLRTARKVLPKHRSAFRGGHDLDAPKGVCPILPMSQCRDCYDVSQVALEMRASTSIWRLGPRLPHGFCRPPRRVRLQPSGPYHAASGRPGHRQESSVEQKRRSRSHQHNGGYVGFKQDCRCSMPPGGSLFALGRQSSERPTTDGGSAKSTATESFRNFSWRREMPPRKVPETFRGETESSEK